MQGMGRILVVEDVEFNQQILIDLLEEQGFTPVTVASGEEALALLAKDHDFTVILMDIGLPGMDGIDACRRIKENPQTRTIPVIALTGHTESERDRFLAAGMDGFAEKTFDTEKILREIARLLPGNAGGQPGQAPTDTGSAPLHLELLRATYVDDGVIRQIAQAYFKDTDPLIARLVESVDNNDLAGIRACCHSIKGAATLFTADEMATLADRLGNLARQGNPIDNKTALVALLEGHQVLRQWLKEHLDLSR